MLNCNKDITDAENNNDNVTHDLKIVKVAKVSFCELYPLST
jgi:hypothetical protein